MLTEDLYSKLISLLRQNEWFMNVLRAVRICNPPDWFVGGDVIRNLVWDHLHKYQQTTPIKDVDVAFFDPNHLSENYDLEIQSKLQDLLPHVPWDAKNQAAVHLWYEGVFGYPVEPLLSSADAIATWPEPATCVGVRLLVNDAIFVEAPYGLDDLFQMTLRRNPRRITEEIFLDRIRSKSPVEKWPRVNIVYDV